MTADLVDTHCHLNFRAFADDLPAVMERAKSAGVGKIVVPAIDMQSCREALTLARRHDEVFCALGIHPNSADEADEPAMRRIREWSSDANVVAIGEIGLDYHWDKYPRPRQVAAFERQLELAVESRLPVIVHNRESTADILAALADWLPSVPADLRERPGVLHSFSGAVEDAEAALEMGFFLGFTGPLTFKNAKVMRAVASAAPLERLLVETDAPFLTPEPYRGKRNEPAHTRLVNAKLADLRGMTEDAMARQTSRNAARLFGWDRHDDG